MAIMNPTIFRKVTLLHYTQTNTVKKIGGDVTAYIVACINCPRRQYMLHELSSAYIVVCINCRWRQYILVSVIMAHTDATLFNKADDHIYMYLR